MWAKPTLISLVQAPTGHFVPDAFRWRVLCRLHSPRGNNQNAVIGFALAKLLHGQWQVSLAWSPADGIFILQLKTEERSGAKCQYIIALLKLSVERVVVLQ